MVCKNCGANIPEGTKFCTSCGATVEAEVGFQDAAVVQAPAKKSNKKLIAIVAGVVAVIVALILVFGGGSYKTPINNYFDAIEKADGAKLQKCSPFAVKFEKAAGESADDIKDDYQESAEFLHEMYAAQYGDDFKITYKIKDKEALDKDELKELQDEINDEIEEEDIDMGKVKITKGYEIEVEVTIKGSDGEDTDDEEFTVVKIDGKWNLW